MPNEQQEFLKSLEQKEGADVLEAPLNPEAVTPEAKTDAEDPEKVAEEVKNRRHRRLEGKLKDEREANIAMAARLETISEAQKFRSENEPSDYVKQIERIYGTNSPEAAEATELLKNALKSVEDRATERAVTTLREEQAAVQAAQRKEEKRLDDMAEDIEDQFNVDLTSPAAAEVRKGFYRQLERMSPKDSDGNITEYADHVAVWEDYQARTKKQPDNRAKALSSRSMTASGQAAAGNPTADDATTRYLVEQGII